MIFRNIMKLVCNAKVHLLNIWIIKINSLIYFFIEFTTSKLKVLLIFKVNNSNNWGLNCWKWLTIKFSLQKLKNSSKLHLFQAVFFVNNFIWGCMVTGKFFLCACVIHTFTSFLLQTQSQNQLCFLCEHYLQRLLSKTVITKLNNIWVGLEILSELLFERCQWPKANLLISIF